MPLRGVSFTLTYLVRYAATGLPVATDAANHTLRLYQDGGAAYTPGNAPTNTGLGRLQPHADFQ